MSRGKRKKPAHLRLVFEIMASALILAGGKERMLRGLIVRETRQIGCLFLSLYELFKRIVPCYNEQREKFFLGP